MRTHHSPKTLLLALALGLFVPAHAAASTIVDYFIDRGGGTVSYNVTGTNWDVTETITGFFNEDSIPPLSYFRSFLAVSGTQGSTIYTVSNSVTNGTGVPWNNFTVVVGCNPVPGRYITGANDCYTYGHGRLVGTPTSSIGSVIVPNAGYFHVKGFSLAPGDTLDLVYQYETCNGCQSSSFLYKYANTPLPEPSTIVLLGSTLLVLPWLRRNRQQEG